MPTRHYVPRLLTPPVERQRSSFWRLPPRADGGDGAKSSGCSAPPTGRIPCSTEKAGFCSYVRRSSAKQTPSRPFAHPVRLNLHAIASRAESVWFCWPGRSIGGIVSTPHVPRTSVLPPIYRRCGTGYSFGQLGSPRREHVAIRSTSCFPYLRPENTRRASRLRRGSGMATLLVPRPPTRRWVTRFPRCVC